MKQNSKQDFYEHFAEVCHALFWACVFILNALAWLVVGMMIGRLP